MHGTLPLVPVPASPLATAIGAGAWPAIRARHRRPAARAGRTGRLAARPAADGRA
jgi:hypothetical protein